MATFSRMADLLELSLRRDIQLEAKAPRAKQPSGAAQAKKEQIQAGLPTKGQQTKDRRPPPASAGKARAQHPPWHRAKAPPPWDRRSGAERRGASGLHRQDDPGACGSQGPGQPQQSPWRTEQSARRADRVDGRSRSPEKRQSSASGERSGSTPPLLPLPEPMRLATLVKLEPDTFATAATAFGGTLLEDKPRDPSSSTGSSSSIIKKRPVGSARRQRAPSERRQSPPHHQRKHGRHDSGRKRPRRANRR